MADLNALQQEIDRRAAFDKENEITLVTGDYLNMARKLFAASPEKFMAENPSIANKLLELDAQALNKQTSIQRTDGLSKADLASMTSPELGLLLFSDFHAALPANMVLEFQETVLALIETLTIGNNKVLM